MKKPRRDDERSKRLTPKKSKSSTEARQAGTIKSLTRQQFDALQPHRDAMAKLLADERAWYSDGAEHVIGMVIFDKSDEDWAWVMMGRDPARRFRAIEVNASLESLDNARDELISAMQRVVESGQTVFEQD